MILIARYWPQLLLSALLVVLTVTGYRWAYGNGYNAANVRAEKIIGDFARAEAEAQERARKVEQQITDKQSEAGDDADAREQQIQADYDRRIAGADRERDRLSKLWGACETSLLSSSAAAAAEAAEQDRLRRESAARVLRAVELAQSERDEAVDRYVAVEQAVRGLE